MAEPFVLDVGCTCAECRQSRLAKLGKRVDPKKAEARAEALLAEHLTPEQASDWAVNVAFNVRGSDGALYRVSPRHNGRANAIQRTETPRYFQPGYLTGHGFGTCVWPVGLTILADIALAMKLYLESNAEIVMRSGCHDYVNASRVTDYEGAI